MAAAVHENLLRLIANRGEMSAQEFVGKVTRVRGDYTDFYGVAAMLHSGYIFTDSTTEGNRGQTTIKPQSGRYALACHRYIELNPVRAGMVRRPEEYRWSSYHDNGLGLADSVLSPHAEYLALGRDAASRRQAYRYLFRSAAEEDSENEIRAATNGNYVCGEPRFQAGISLMLNRRVSRKPAGRPKRATEDRDAV